MSRTIDAEAAYEHMRSSGKHYSFLSVTPALNFLSGFTMLAWLGYGMMGCVSESERCPAPVKKLLQRRIGQFERNRFLNVDRAITFTICKELYDCMRHIDNEIDEHGLDDTAFVERKLEFLQGEQPIDDIERAWRKVETYAEEAGRSPERLRAVARSVIHAFAFDIQRRERRSKGELYFPSKDELDSYLHNLEIEGTLAGYFAAANVDHNVYDFVPLITAARKHYYFTRDFREDVRNGFVNFPAEELPAPHAVIEQMAHGENVSIVDWEREQATAGMQLLDAHKTSGVTDTLGLEEKVFLEIEYERPARKYFSRLLERRCSLHVPWNTVRYSTGVGFDFLKSLV